MTIHLIRHGQSEFNAAYKGAGDPIIWDAPLTPKGRTQALELRQKTQTLGLAQLICSPLTRAIQTARIGFPDFIPQVWALAHEHQEHSCDVGRSAFELAQDFPELQFDHLPDPWGYQGTKNAHGVAVEPNEVFKARMAELYAALRALPPGQIGLVCHGYVIRELTGVDPENCQIVTLER